MAEIQSCGGWSGCANNFFLFPFYSSGRSSPTSMASTVLETMMAPPTCSWRESMCTTTRPAWANTCPVPSSSILSPAPWILSEQDPMGSFSGLTTLFLDSLVLATTGLRATTLKVKYLIINELLFVPHDFLLQVLSWLTLSLMLCARRLSPVTAFRASNSPTPLVAALDLAWAPFSSLRSGRSTPTGS